jgi:outer membrane murein-binding lipoprotein Lpp
MAERILISCIIHVDRTKVHKRASNVQKLTQENEKLQAQLKAMAEQLEAMERLRAKLAAKEQKNVEKPSS